MSPVALRILLLADTHLGFDLPQRPRIHRRRRGPDFFANYERALQPACRGKVDLVVHGGDLFYRSRVPPVVIEEALTPLAEIARSGVPVFLVPGNHDGSRIPFHLAVATPNFHIFHRPQTVVTTVKGITLSVSGIPFARQIRGKFESLLAECDASVDVDCRLLCLHQSVEGAIVGAQNYVFRAGPEVIGCHDIPASFDAVLAGHIHRSQLLTRDLSGQDLPVPIVYPGAIERTSFAERLEEKHYALVTMTRPAGQARFQTSVAFESLPTRPMIVLSVNSRDSEPAAFKAKLGEELAALDRDSVVQLRFTEPLLKEMAPIVNAASLRSIAPPTMNISLSGHWQGEH